MKAYHFGVWPPRRSVFVFFASFPSRAAQYGSCFPMDLRLGRFFARSTIMTKVPISGPSTVISANMPAEWTFTFSAMFAIFVLCVWWRGRWRGVLWPLGGGFVLLLTSSRVTVQKYLEVIRGAGFS